jgi:Ca2+-binding RTX toxin-like protein
MVARVGTGTLPEDPPIVVARIVSIDGTDKADVLNGTDDHNLMRGFGGDDRMFGFAGDDLLIGGTGADFLDGGTGTFDTAGYMDSDVGVTVNLALGFGRFGTAEGDRLVNVDDIIGSPHRDTLIGNDGSNRLMGEVGDDMLTGGFGADFLFGGDGGNPPPSPADGNDTAVYSDSPVGVTVNLATGRGFGGTAEGDTFVSIENIAGSFHNDILTGNDVANFLHASNGDDILKGAGGADILHGNGGNDTLKGGGGADVLEGNTGIDTAAYNDSPAGVFVSLITDTADFGDAEGDELFNIENLTGSGFHDDLWGNDGANVINGMAGNDTLKGFGGDDTLNGEAGVDTMFGALGNDTYLVDNAGDIVRENGGQGNDTVRASVSYVLTAGADVETLRTTSDAGTATINLTGNANGNVVIGNIGNNRLGGGGGNDQLTGGNGQDEFLFDTALNAATNVDRITDFNVADDTILLDRDIFSSSLGLGNISAGEFVIGTTAQDANDRIIYDSSTGALFYDNDGVGGNAAVRFATLSTGLALTNLDFLVVA